MSILVFSPHEDDETLACGGTIIKKVRERHRVSVIFMTDGSKSHDHLNTPENPGRGEIKLIRRHEAEEAARLLGLKGENIIFLDFEDNTLEAEIPKAVVLVQEILSKARPAEIFMPHKHDSHRDHCAANAIVSSAVRALRLDADIYEYIIWSDTTMLRQILKSPDIVSIDVFDVVELKKRAIAAYRSQVDILFPGQAAPVLGPSLVERFRQPFEFFSKHRMKNGERQRHQSGKEEIASGYGPSQ